MSLREKVRGFVARDQWRDGRRFLEEEVAQRPGDAEARAHLGFFCVKESRYDTVRGLAEFDEALRIDPKCFTANLYRAVTLAYLGKYADAVECLRAAEATGAAVDDLLWAQGCVELEAGSVEKARGLFHRLVEVHPDSTNFIMLAKSYYQSDRTEDSLVWLAKAEKSDPEDFRPLVYRGIYLVFLHRLNEAHEVLSRAEQMNKNYALLQHTLGYLDVQEGKPVDAERRFRAALTIDPDYVTSMKMLADLCAVSGRRDEAEKLYSAALRVFPDYPQAREGLLKLKGKP